MNNLIIFYSRTGNTKQLAELISQQGNWKFEEIIDTKKRKGIIGFLKSGYEATRKKLTIIKELEKNPALFDSLILGTPIWNKRMSTPIRTFIVQNKSKMKKIAFFCTEGSKGGFKTFENMAELCGMQPTATLEITKQDIKNDLHLNKVKNFVQEISSN
ncbi:MAG: flavodoxin family protein [Promethearchaeota archaeon]